MKVCSSIQNHSVYKQYKKTFGIIKLGVHSLVKFIAVSKCPSKFCYPSISKKNTIRIDGYSTKLTIFIGRKYLGRFDPKRAQFINLDQETVEPK